MDKIEQKTKTTNKKKKPIKKITKKGNKKV